MLYMGATRTQIYLTEEQRMKLDARGRREGKTLAQLVREALDAYLTEPVYGAELVKEILDRTFGAAPNIKVPSRDEWARGYG
jgi:predicted DNA-binding protein